MKKFSMLLAIAIVVGGLAVSCSSKETKMEEPVISGSTGSSAPVESANLGGSSSGQGR